MPKLFGGGGSYQPSAAELKAQRDAAMNTRGVQSEMLTEMENASSRSKLNDKETSALKSALEQKSNKVGGSARPIGAETEIEDEVYGTGIKIRNKTGS